MDGKPNPIYPQVFPDQDFAADGYWFWLKSSKAHGFDVKSFAEKFIYMRSTELTWKDNTSFKLFDRHLPISQRCVPEGKAGPEIKVADQVSVFRFLPGVQLEQHTAVNDLDAPQQSNLGGKIGPTRVLHYHYNGDKHYQNCSDKEEFYLANAYGFGQWKHYKNGELVKTALMRDLQQGRANRTLPCPESYR